MNATRRLLLALFIAAPGCLSAPDELGTLALEATSSACTGGDFRAVLPGGRVLSGYTTFKLRPAELPAHSRIRIRGRYVEFDVDVSDLAVYGYTLTGAASPQDLTGGVRTPVFASKVPDHRGATLDDGELEVRFDPAGLVLRRRGRALSMKIQAKDCATGGIFQMEPEPASGAATTVTHTLAPGMYYFVNPFTGRVNFGNGTAFRGKDSPQVATRLAQTDAVTVWSVASGGRMGGVLGEDAVELSGGASACVQDCQAQNRVRGSLPVTDPAFSN